MVLRHCLIISSLFILLTGCGYSFNDGSASVLDERHRVLAIEGVDNPTTITWLEPRLRKLLRDELTRRGTVAWTDEQKDADALIRIDIQRYYRPTVVEGEGEQTLRSSAIFKFEAVVTSTLDGSEVWRSGTITQDWPFFSGQEDEADEEVTRLGIRRLADRMALNF